MTEQIAITEEAKKLIAEELRSLAEELEKEAIAEALRSRGRPVEVTASDVRRARIRFVKRDRPLLPVTDLLLRAYLVGGLLVFVGGFMYPIVRPLFLEQDPVSRMSFLISLAGLMVASVGFLGRFYLKWRDGVRIRRQHEEYEQQRRDAMRTRGL